MKKFFLLVLATLFFGAMTTFAQDLDEILEEHYEITGMEVLKEKKSMKATGKSVQFGQENKFTHIVLRPDKMYLEVEMQGQFMKQAYDGEEGWIVMPWTGTLKPTVLTGIQLKSARMAADMEGTLYDYKEKGYETRLVGKEDLEGTEVYLIEQTDADGDVYKQYIDAESMVLLKTSAKMQMQGNEVDVETLYSNYEMVDGIAIAYSIDVVSGGQVIRQIIVEETFFDVEVDEAIFSKPETE